MAALLAVRAWRMLPGLLIQAAVAETLIGFVDRLRLSRILLNGTPDPGMAGVPARH
jgi:hypothetical protein